MCNNFLNHCPGNPRPEIHPEIHLEILLVRDDNFHRVAAVHPHPVRPEYNIRIRIIYFGRIESKKNTK